jgi:hypothetical protein
MAAPKKEDYEYFAFVVDNEVAAVIPMNKDNLAQWVAALSSDPKVIKLEEDQKEVVISGWTFDGENFSSPTEN